MSKVRITLLIVATVALFTAAYCQQGYATNGDDWGYTWYKNEAFRMYCNSSILPVTSSDYITWTTPHLGDLVTPYNDADYELKAWFGVEGYELFVKRIHPPTQGVYVCRVVSTANDTLRGRGIIGLNIHEPKYHDLYDKYRDNMVRAFIVSGTLLGTIAFTCSVYQCRYRPGQSRLGPWWGYNRQPKSGRDTRGHNGLYGDIWMAAPKEEAYDNPIMWTKL